VKAEHKEAVISEVIRRITVEKIQNADKIPLETIIADTIYHERKRLENGKTTKKAMPAILYWKKMNKRLIHASEAEKQAMLQELSQNFVREIIGNFNPKVYQFATKALPILLNILLNAMSPRIFSSHFPHWPELSDRLLVQGEIQLLQQLAQLGTVILVPTHSSHMDSIVVGWALHRLGLPAFTYGAAISLFKNRLIGYFMGNLGAYRVDRQKTAVLYKEILKEYTTGMLEYGYHTLFFPGGTRSRSGAIETHLKLGLLGSGLRAYINNLIANNPKPNIFVVPCTISYQLVLEAEHLIQDELKSTGKSQYISEDDEFSQIRRILNFLAGILRLDSRLYVHFCPAMDLFGNLVNEQGMSFDHRGRPVDITRYLLVSQKIAPNIQRDMQYTRELGEEIQKSYLKNNVVMSTHLAAFVVHELLKKHNPEMDLYRLLRTGGKEETLAIHEVYEASERVLSKLKKLESSGQIRIDPHIRDASVDQIFDEALRHFRAYHTKEILVRQGDRLDPNDCNLLYYYHNRLLNYELEKEIEG